MPLETRSLRATPVAVFGPDDRRELPERYSALEGKVGMVYEPVSQTLCTAFCVAPDIVATAAHCLFQPKGSKLPNTAAMSFRLEYGKVSLSSGLAGAASGMEKNFVAVGTTKFNQEPPLSAPLDWALARLERPVCKFGALDVVARTPTELAQATSEKRIFQVAYHWDYRHWRLAYSGPCAVSRTFNNLQWRAIQQHFTDSEELILHDCDTGGASSGSPILMDTPSGPVAVAINVGTYTRTRLFLREGRVVKRLKPDVIANTGVSARAFRHVIPELKSAQILDTREDLARLQVELQARGLYAGRIDGSLGRNMRSAIRSFEAVSGLPATGLPTQRLLELISKDRERPSVDYSTGTGAWREPTSPPSP
ncbi:MAG: peptidoglycan-binding domain-containing protein [Hyphomicrobiales bacterium]|nr:peptidoglycan-binding domain-containing protein [Hyphomicrobiales bacterium]